MKKDNVISSIIALGVIVYSFFYAASGLVYAQSFQDANDYLILVDIRIENYPDAARIVLRTNRYFEYVDYQLEGKFSGIVFDPTEPFYVNAEKFEFDKEGLISDVKLVKGVLRDKELPLMLQSSFYPLDYFVICALSKTEYRISQRANLLVIDIGARRLPILEEFILSSILKKKKINVSKQVMGQSTRAVSPNNYPLPQGERVRVRGLDSNESPSSFSSPHRGEEMPEPLESRPINEALRQPGGTTSPKAAQKQATGDTFEKFRDKVMGSSMAAKTITMGLPKTKNTLGYKECLEIATVNYLPLSIAEEEMKLTNMKVDEARRGLFPTATAKYTTTDGKTMGVEFEEKSYGVQVEQPIYYGGRLTLALKQAQVNREVAQTKFDKAEAELVSKVTEAFYNTATAQLNLNDQKGLIDKSKEMLAIAEKKYQAELTNKLEFLNVQSQCNQIEYQLAVAVKDLEIARVNLLQALGVEPSAEVFVDFSLDYKERNIDLNKCLMLAYQNRPELQMNELLQEASDYEEKIARSKDDFKVDFAGFLGESGGAYKTESLDLGSDWYVGLKASKPWLGNTGSYSFAENKTSPKLGQSTRTEGTSHSLEFGILNNLTGYSEKQSALIGKLKAENELIEMEKTINTEVREAYNNYQKAVMQIKNTSEKIAFREEEVKVLQAQAEINEALSSQVLEAMVKLSDEKALYHQAIASYKTALANLNKAIGIIGYFD